MSEESRTSSPASASDAGYHQRHLGRSLRRARCIADNIEGPASILDVGCNYGVTSRYLLENGKAGQVTGVELHAHTVAPDLRRDSRFTLVEGNIAEIMPDGRFDYVIYGAVHHHVLHFHGLTTSISTLQKLAGACSRSLFFETGQLSEGGRWGWQRSMCRYFRTDEEHFFYLLRSIEHLVDEFSIIGRFWMHGIRRCYLKIDLKPVSRRVEIESSAVPSDAGGPWVRSFGSRGQSLSPAGEDGSDDSPVLFWSRTQDDGMHVFCKRHLHHPIAALTERFLGSQIPFDWAVRPVGPNARADTLVFRNLWPSAKVIDMRMAPAAVRRDLADQVLHSFADAGTFRPEQVDGVLLPKRAAASLLDLCDFNPNNCLVVAEDGTDRVYFVDFEQQSTRYRGRNRLHLARILWSLGQYRLRATLEFVLGWCALLGLLLRSQALPIDSRIRMRQPSILSIVTVGIRTRVGAAAKSVLRIFVSDEAGP